MSKPGANNVFFGLKAATLATALLLALPAFAATRSDTLQDWKWCNGAVPGISLDLQVESCGALIQLGRDEDLFDAYFHRGLAYYQKGSYAEALADLNAALGREPTNADALGARALARFHQGQFELAIADLTAVIAQKPTSADSYYQRATAYALEGKFDQSIADLDRAIALKRNFAEAYYNRG